MPEETFDFLGYTFGRCYSPQTGRAYLARARRRRRCSASVDAISELTGREQTLLDAGAVVGKLNRMLRGLGELLLSGSGQQGLPGRGAARRHRLRQWLCGSTRCGAGDGTFPDEYLHEVWG